MDKSLDPKDLYSWVDAISYGNHSDLQVMDMGMWYSSTTTITLFFSKSQLWEHDQEQAWEADLRTGRSGSQLFATFEPQGTGSWDKVARCAMLL